MAKKKKSHQPPAQPVESAQSEPRGQPADLQDSLTASTPATAAAAPTSAQVEAPIQRQSESDSDSDSSENAGGPQLHADSFSDESRLQLRDDAAVQAPNNETSAQRDQQPTKQQHLIAIRNSVSSNSNRASFVGANFIPEPSETAAQHQPPNRASVSEFVALNIVDQPEETTQTAQGGQDATKRHLTLAPQVTSNSSFAQSLHDATLLAQHQQQPQRSSESQTESQPSQTIAESSDELPSIHEDDTDSSNSTWLEARSKQLQLKPQVLVREEQHSQWLTTQENLSAQQRKEQESVQLALKQIRGQVLERQQSTSPTNQNKKQAAAAAAAVSATAEEAAEEADDPGSPVVIMSAAQAVINATRWMKIKHSVRASQVQVNQLHLRLQALEADRQAMAKSALAQQQAHDALIAKIRLDDQHRLESLKQELQFARMLAEQRLLESQKQQPLNRATTAAPARLSGTANNEDAVNPIRRVNSASDTNEQRQIIKLENEIDQQKQRIEQQLVEDDSVNQAIQRAQIAQLQSANARIEALSQQLHTQQAEHEKIQQQAYARAAFRQQYQGGRVFNTTSPGASPRASRRGSPRGTRPGTPNRTPPQSAQRTANPSPRGSKAHLWRQASGRVINGLGPGSAIPSIESQLKKKGVYGSRFGLYARSMARLSACVSLVMGAASILWWYEETLPLYNVHFMLIAGVYSIVAGLLVLVYETKFGLSRGDSSFPSRGLAYIALSVVSFFSWPTLMSAIFFVTTGVVNIVACVHGEVYDRPKTKAERDKEAADKLRAKVKRDARSSSVAAALSAAQASEKRVASPKGAALPKNEAPAKATNSHPQSPTSPPQQQHQPQQQRPFDSPLQPQDSPSERATSPSGFMSPVYLPGVTPHAHQQPHKLYNENQRPPPMHPPAPEAAHKPKTPSPMRITIRSPNSTINSHQTQANFDAIPILSSMQNWNQQNAQQQQQQQQQNTLTSSSMSGVNSPQQPRMLSSMFDQPSSPGTQTSNNYLDDSTPNRHHRHTKSGGVASRGMPKYTSSSPQLSSINHTQILHAPSPKLMSDNGTNQSSPITSNENTLRSNAPMRPRAQNQSKRSSDADIHTAHHTHSSSLYNIAPSTLQPGGMMINSNINTNDINNDDANLTLPHNSSSGQLGTLSKSPSFKGAINKAEAQSKDIEQHILSRIAYRLISAREQNKIGHICFILVYVGINVALFTWYLGKWLSHITELKRQVIDGTLHESLVISDWAPIAKGFGILLDFNCALILLPVCRTLIRALYNQSTADHGWSSRLVRAVLFFLPIDENLAFHIVLAKVVFFAASMHTTIHFINFALTPQAALTAFGGAWTIVSGGIICWFMLILYSATAKSVKNGQFEIFWYCHHSFVPFFGFLIAHGKNGLNPNIWKFILLPGTLYLIERLLRVYRSRKQVVLLSVTLMDDVFALEFSKQGVFERAYKEGQYIFLNCPMISKSQWHPFTISSAPMENTVTVHIRVQCEGSWTRRVATLMSAMGPRHATWFELERSSELGKAKGKIFGPDGVTPLFSIDGPHSAPTQHLGEYSSVLVCGAGIGATPLASTLRSVIFHRWKYSIGLAYPDHVCFAWVCAHKDIDAFRWLIRNIKEAQDEVVHMREKSRHSMRDKSFVFHIYVTSVPTTAKPIDVVVDDEVGFWGVPRDDPLVYKMYADWDEADLYRCMKCPQQEHTQMMDVHVHNGRPQWTPLFTKLSAKYPRQPVGVLYCGNAHIARDLKKASYVQNVKRKADNLFQVHLENF